MTLTDDTLMISLHTYTAMNEKSQLTDTMENAWKEYQKKRKLLASLKKAKNIQKKSK